MTITGSFGHRSFGTAGSRRRGGGGSAPLVVVPYAAPYEDKFTTSGAMTGRANWAAASGAPLANWSVDNGYMHYNNLFGPTSTLTFGPSMTDFVYTTGYATTNATDPTHTYNVNFQDIVIWYQDDSNYLYVQIDVPNQRLWITGKKGGTAISNVQWSVAPYTLLARGEILFLMVGGVLKVRLDGKWLSSHASATITFPYDRHDFTNAYPLPADRQGKVGWRGQTYLWELSNHVAVRPVEITIDSIDRAVGLDSVGASGGKCLVSGTYVGNPTSFVARVLDYNTVSAVSPTVVANWAAMTGVTFGSGTWSGYVFLPIGGHYAVEAGFVDSSDGKTRSITSPATMCGHRVIYYGQSNSTGRSTTAPGGYVPSYTAAWLTGTSANLPSDFKGNTDYSGPAIPALAETAKVASAQLGNAPVLAEWSGQSGVALADLIPTGAYWPTFTNQVAAGRGIIEAVIWDQGEGNADNTGSPLSTYADTWINTLLPAMKTATGNPNLKVLVSLVGRFASATAPNGYAAATIDDRRETLRQQLLLCVASDPTNIAFAPSKLGAIHVDAYHYTAAGYVEICRRDGFSLAKMLGGSGHDGLGPQVTGATRSGSTITLATTVPTNCTGLTLQTLATGTVPTPTLGNANYGFQVSADNFTTTLPISSVTVSGSNIILTMSSAPAGAVKVRSHYGWSYDDTNLVAGTYSDTANIPVFPIITPILST